MVYIAFMRPVHFDYFCVYNRTDQPIDNAFLFDPTFDPKSAFWVF